ncbi:hypothetical protein HVS_15770 [Acetivibrio saccincola]|jgi:hypothetical protein|uniref:Uncharacterized protein n=1 Tax=Acetivibrio saccincola TaxID=1677857 RepID=A0A2K9EFS2_9FIRM|nr:hypothetical protein HVS_15770 [Acetivibrio saccincola]
MSKIELLNDIIEYLITKAMEDWEIFKKEVREDYE